jgi:hypothetical protein
MKKRTETEYAGSETHAEPYFGVPVATELFVKLGTGSGNDAAADEDKSSLYEVDAWARHADVTSGFGYVAAELPRPSSFELHKAAFAHRAFMLGSLMREATGAIAALLREGYVRLRRANSKKAMMSVSTDKPKGRELRARVAAAFRKMAHAVGEPAAHRATQRFYRSSGMAWTRGLN